MGIINENAKLNIQCPQCNTKFSKTIRELKGPGVQCPSCRVRFETSQFKKGLDDVKRSFADFQRNLKNIKIDIKL